MKKIIILSFIAICALHSGAQFNQSISVEGKYVPEVFKLDRINTFPRQVKFSLESTPLNYDGKSVPAAFAPSLIAMPATGWRDTRNWSDSRGYLDLGAGSWLNSTLSAGYRFIDDQTTTFGIRFQHNSTSLWKPKVYALRPDTKMSRYDESAGLYASHKFEGKGSLSAAVDYHIGNFNYYGFNPYMNIAVPELLIASDLSGTAAPEVPTQTLNDISANFLWQSPSRDDEFSWSAGAAARYFGYRVGSREADINILGDFNLPLAGGSSFGVDLNTHILHYGGHVWRPKDYGLVTLTPYYRFSRDRLLVRVGADLDLSLNANSSMDGESHYGFLHIAPDVKIDYLAGPVSIYFHALGGSSLNTLASNHDLDYYQSPFIRDTTPTYSPLDGSLGATFGPFSGFSAGLDFAFRITRGQSAGGWYTASLNAAGLPMAGLPETLFIDNMYRSLSYNYLDSDSYNIRGISLGVRASYDLGNILKIEAKGNYQPQNGTTGYFNGYDRPRWTANISAETNPWKRLKLKLAYDYRGVRNIYTVADYEGALISKSQELVGLRLPDITSLNFGASYGFTDRFALWVQADNLLNRHDITLPCLPQQGVSITGGLSLIF